MAFIFKLTTEGRNALINALQNGTAARTVVSVGITAQSIAPGSPVTGEIKRIATIAGEVVALDTMHVTIRDETSDTYTIRGFGMYLDNGVLLGSYGQADPIINKTSASIMLLSTDARVVDGSVDITTLIFGEANFANPVATTIKKGIVELATQQESAEGLSDELAVTPAGLRFATSNRMPFFTADQPLPTINIGPIWHESYQSVMTWRVFDQHGANYIGYASVDIGYIRPDTQPDTRAAWIKTGIVGLPTTLTLYHWAKHHALVQEVGWLPGTLFYRDFGNGTFGTPDVRAESIRFQDEGRGIDPERGFGTSQKGSLLCGNEMADAQTHAFHNVAANRVHMGWDPYPTDHIYYADMSYSPNSVQSVGMFQDNHYGIARARNTAFPGVIHI